VRNSRLIRRVALTVALVAGPTGSVLAVAASSAPTPAPVAKKWACAEVGQVKFGACLQDPTPDALPTS